MLLYVFVCNIFFLLTLFLIIQARRLVFEGGSNVRVHVLPFIFDYVIMCKILSLCLRWFRFFVVTHIYKMRHPILTVAVMIPLFQVIIVSVLIWVCCPCDMCNVLVCIVSRDIVAVERSRVSRCRVPFAVCRSLFAVRCLPFAVCRSLSVVCCLLFEV